MRSLPRTKIEYGDYGWNWLRGCSNGPDICATHGTCWARTMAHRFRSGQGFTPTVDVALLDAVFPRSPARILVCFTGEIADSPISERIRAYARIVSAPQHRFLLLTKRPMDAYFDYFRWPPNVLLGMSLTGKETPQQQQTLLASLLAIPGDHRLWLSYEPMLGPLTVSLEGIDWLVMGAQTGKGAVKPDISWYYRVWDAWQLRPFPIWEKSNLEPFLHHWRNGWERVKQVPERARRRCSERQGI